MGGLLHGKAGRKAKEKRSRGTKEQRNKGAEGEAKKLIEYI
jgi:hypothetical protein